MYLYEYVQKLYQPRTADPNTLTLGNLLTLTNIITSGIDHYSPSLGAFTSVQVAMPYLQKHETTSLSERFRHIPTHYFQGSQYLIT